MTSKEIENWIVIGISVSSQITRPNPMQYIKGYNWQSKDKFQFERSRGFQK